MARACARGALTITPKHHDLAAAMNAASLLFHEARGRERAGDDGTDVDTATPRLTRRLGTANRLGTGLKGRQRPGHCGEVRHRCERRRNPWLGSLLLGPLGHLLWS